MLEQETASLLGKFDDYIDEYTSFVCPNIKRNNSIEKILNYSFHELSELSDVECLNSAYELCAYVVFLDNELSRNKAKLAWCQDTINYICAKEWNNYDPYLKYDIKRSSIINENVFAQKVESLRSYLQCNVTLLENKISDIRRMVQILEDLSRRKAFK